MKRALIIPTDQSPYTVMVNHPEGDFIREVVGGWFDCVRGDKFHGYVNDTGIIDGLPMNKVASIMFGRYLAGNVIVFGSFSASGEYDGYEHSIDPHVAEVARYQHLIMRTHENATTVRCETN